MCGLNLMGLSAPRSDSSGIIDLQPVKNNHGQTQWSEVTLGQTLLKLFPCRQSKNFKI